MSSSGSALNSIWTSGLELTSQWWSIIAACCSTTHIHQFTRAWPYWLSDYLLFMVSDVYSCLSGSSEPRWPTLDFLCMSEYKTRLIKMPVDLLANDMYELKNWNFLPEGTQGHILSRGQDILKQRVKKVRIASIGWILAYSFPWYGC